MTQNLENRIEAIANSAAALLAKCEADLDTVRAMFVDELNAVCEEEDAEDRLDRIEDSLIEDCEKIVKLFETDREALVERAEEDCDCYDRNSTFITLCKLALNYEADPISFLVY